MFTISSVNISLWFMTLKRWQLNQLCLITRLIWIQWPVLLITRRSSRIWWSLNLIPHMASLSIWTNACCMRQVMILILQELLLLVLWNNLNCSISMNFKRINQLSNYLILLINLSSILWWKSRQVLNNWLFQNHIPISLRLKMLQT